MDIIEAKKLLENKLTTSENLVKNCLQKIEKSDLNLINSICADAIEKAKQSDERRASGKSLSILDGIPIVIKDNINKIGTKTTCSSNFLKNNASIYDATVVQKLEQAGAIIVAKANMDEFAMGSSNENSAFGPAKNPLNNNRVTGGSSGGSAGAVAGDLCIASLGTDTGGSVRQPASFCGVVGLKPTYGLISRFGVVAFASSLDQVGPLTKTVKDSAIMLDCLAGFDEKENTSAKQEKNNYYDNVDGKISGLKVGFDKNLLNKVEDKTVVEQVKKSIEHLKKNGAEIVDVDLSIFEYAIDVYYILASAEASSNLGRFDGVRFGTRADINNLSELYLKSRTEGFGKEVKRRIMLGNFVLSSGYFDAYYKKAQKVREKIKQQVQNCFEKCNVILTPTTPTVAFEIGEKTHSPLEMYLEDIFTVPVNMIEMPAISVPFGKNKDNMPVGIQFIANKFDEKTLFNFAECLERGNK